MVKMAVAEELQKEIEKIRAYLQSFEARLR